MQAKYIGIIVIALVVVGGLAYLFSGQNQTSQPAVNVPAAPVSVGQQTVTSVTLKNGIVAGVDLSGFAAEANQSAALSSQDGAATGQAMSADGSGLNSSLDSVSNPIQ